MGHPNESEARRTRSEKMRHMVGRASEYPNDRADRIAGKLAPTKLGDPAEALRDMQELPKDPIAAVRQMNTPKKI